MRILFPLFAYYPSQIGGPCNTLYWHASELKKHNFSPKIVTSSIGIDEEKEVEFNKFILNESGKVYYGNGKWSFVRILFVSVKSIKKSEIIHLNGLFSLISIVTFFYAKIFHSKKPIIWSVRGELNNNALAFSKNKKKILLFFYKKFCKNIVLHGTSRQEVLDIKKVFANADVFLLPNYIQTSKRYDLVMEKRILFVGRIHPIKALEKLIVAVSESEIFKKSDFVLNIAGKNEDRYQDYKEELIKLVDQLGLSSKIKFLGHIKGKNKQKLYASSYALILPSESENFGNVVVESLNQGTPVIASLGTPWGVLEEYECGKHVSNEPRSLANSIDWILSKSESEYFEMRANSVKLIDEKFNVSTQIITWVKKYAQILNKEHVNEASKFFCLVGMDFCYFLNSASVNFL